MEVANRQLYNMQQQLDPNNDFSMLLANALSIDLGCKEFQSGVISVKKECPKTQEDRIQSCLNALEAALKQMQKEGNPTPALIIDHVNFLVENNAKIFYLCCRYFSGALTIYARYASAYQKTSALTCTGTLSSCPIAHMRAYYVI